MEAKPKSAALALPLRVNGSETTIAIWIEDANGKRVATVKNCETDSDRAEFIVRACNSHADLVSALRGLVKAGHSLHNGSIEWRAVHAALDKATGAA